MSPSLAENAGPAPASALASRYVPLACAAVALLVLLLIPLRIISYGYVPPGDARRHVAKAFTDKPYTEIVVMRPEYSMDHSPGWEWMLKQVKRATGAKADSLAALSVVVAMAALLLAPLPWLRRPEAWLAAWLMTLVALPSLMTRLAQGRPYLVSEGILVAILMAWRRDEAARPGWGRLILTTLAMALSTWVHGAWYLWALPIAAYFAAGWWRPGLWLGGCAAVGVVAGAAVTGKPVEFLRQALLIASVISREGAPQSLLVGEFRPSDGSPLVVIGLAIVLLASAFVALRGRLDGSRDGLRLLEGPVPLLAVAAWILGFSASRFWLDWGVPAAATWAALRLQGMMEALWPTGSWRRVAASGLLALGLFLHASHDDDSRYSVTRREALLDASRPGAREWLPDPGGILYSAEFTMFFNTFYQNPGGDWRYIMGMEPALMPESDLKVFRGIQLGNGLASAYEPWVEKMTGRDRLAIVAGEKPPLPALEWKEMPGNIWLGRRPRGDAKR